MREQVNLRVTAHNHKATKGLNEGAIIKGTLYEQSVQPLIDREIEVLALTSGGQPAIVVSRFGKGEAMLAGSYLGMANFPDVDENNDRFFLNLLEWANIDKPFTTSLDGRTTAQVEVRLLENNKGYLLFAINHSSETEVINIELAASKNNGYKITDMLKEEVKPFQTKNNLINLTCSLDKKQVQIWSIERE
jgi:beta-galactosidase